MELGAARINPIQVAQLITFTCIKTRAMRHEFYAITMDGGPRGNVVAYLDRPGDCNYYYTILDAGTRHHARRVWEVLFIYILL